MGKIRRLQTPRSQTKARQSTMFDQNGRVDIPRIMKGLSSSSDAASQQNAAAVLGYIACHSEEYRDAIAAQLEAIIVPLTKHLKSGQVDLVHNAALLLGQCCVSGSEFRQAFGAEGSALLASMLGSDDKGILCNVLFALRQYVADVACPISALLRQDILSALPRLLERDANPRVQQNAKMLQHLMEQRPAPPPPPRPATMNLRRDDSLAAVSALTSLATAQTSKQDELLAWGIKLLESSESSPDCTPESSPTGEGDNSISLEVKSPNKRRPSLLAPWKKASAHSPSVKTKKASGRTVALAATTCVG